MGVGAPSGTAVRSNAGLATAASPSCPAVVTTTIAPAIVLAHAPMTVHVNVTLGSGVPAICDHAVRMFTLGLPAGCAVDTAATYTCFPMVTGTFHVQTVVIALNTATTATDTLVVH